MKKNSSIIFILLLTAVLFGCKQDHTGINPKDCADNNVSYVAGSDFSLNKTSPSIVDFTTTDTLQIRAVLTQPSPWTVTIRGLKSHAVKIITGYSSTIDTTWYGRPTGNVLFISEQVSVTLDILCQEKLSRTGNVNILMGNYSKDPNLVIVSNFDDMTAPIGLDTIIDTNYGRGTFDTAYCPSKTKSGFCFGKPSPQGGNSLVFKGINAITAGESKNSYANYEIYPPASFYPKFPAGTLPSDTWLNFYAHSSGTPVKVTVAFVDNNNNKLGKVSLSIDSTEWKMYSINLAQLVKGPDNPATFDVHELQYFTMTFGQVNAVSPTYFNIDMISFSRKESFQGEMFVK